MNAPSYAIKNCRACGASIFWGRSPAGLATPLDVMPTPDGEYVIAEHGDLPTLRRVGGGFETEPRFRVHFQLCPNVGSRRHRTRRGRSSLVADQVLT